MLEWVLFFFIIAVIAGIFGFTGIETATMDVAKILFFIFIAIAVILLLLGMLLYRTVV
jgi:uncharacterized membrane protein YtjA (UPF0391 family)